MWCPCCSHSVAPSDMPCLMSLHIRALSLTFPLFASCVLQPPPLQRSQLYRLTTAFHPKLRKAAAARRNGCMKNSLKAAVEAEGEKAVAGEASEEEGTATGMTTALAKAAVAVVAVAAGVEEVEEEDAEEGEGEGEEEEEEEAEAADGIKPVLAALRY